MMRRVPPAIIVVLALFSREPAAAAHSGPPFPIVSNRIAGAYIISVWTDPDTTDDGKPAGQFWVMLDPADRTVPIPAATHATVTVRPLDRAGATRTGRTSLVNGAVSRQFVALLMDHEGPFAVAVAVEGPAGPVTVESQVNATYDLRPARGLLALYLLPFLAIGALWGKVLLRRRPHRAPRR
jgi:hypothetical protein